MPDDQWKGPDRGRPGGRSPRPLSHAHLLLRVRRLRADASDRSAEQHRRALHRPRCCSCRPAKSCSPRRRTRSTRTTTSHARRLPRRPQITAYPSSVRPFHSYSISGRTFNGLSQAVGYGDDAAAATNYPLVRIRHNASGRVHYCRTWDHSTMGVATGSSIQSTTFFVPLRSPAVRRRSA